MMLARHRLTAAVPELLYFPLEALQALERAGLLGRAQLTEASDERLSRVGLTPDQISALRRLLGP